MLEALTDLVWSEVAILPDPNAATSVKDQNKFADSIELSYSGLDTFFGGLEGVIGSPNPNLLEAMQAEHLKGPLTESTDMFVTANYGIRTNSQAEWVYVYNTETAPQHLGLECWPEESEERLPDRGKCRQRRSLSDLLDAAKSRNLKLEEAGQPGLVDEEIIAANLYTGPMFVKYNAVLRGLRSKVAYLKTTMIKLCCPREVANRYADHTIPLDVAMRSLNKYTTTLHGINSAIIKLGKLTKATKVYRGISGMKLPRDFWEPNEFGVKGGVESAFMSTTLERTVAMGYAAGDRSKAGIVIEVEQGMVNRGADISWLSQYVHEAEILFGPLTGIEVLRTRIDRSVVVIECAFSINLTALTLEQVLGKRRKLLSDTRDNMRIEVRNALADRNEVRFEDVGATLVEREANRVALRHDDPAWYNTDANFQDAVLALMDVKRRVLEPQACCELVGRWLDATDRKPLLQQILAQVEASAVGERAAIGAMLRGLREGGVGLDELRSMGASVVALSLAGFAVQEVREVMGLSVAQACGLWSMSDLQVGGVKALELRKEGVSPEELRSGGFGGDALREAGWSIDELGARLFMDGSGWRELARLPRDGRPGFSDLCLLSSERLASSRRDKTVCVWFLKTGTAALTLEGHTDAVTCVCALDGDRLASGSKDRTVRVWDLKTGTTALTLKGHTNGVNCLCKLDGERLASGGEGHVIRVFDLTTGASVPFEGHDGDITSLCKLEGERLASGSSDNTARVWDLETRKAVLTLEGHEEPVISVCALGNERLASSGWDWRTGIHVWNLTTGKVMLTFKGHGEPATCLCTLDHERLASSSKDKTVRVWDLKTGKQLIMLEPRNGDVWSVRALGDERLASCADNIHIWDVGMYNSRLSGSR